MHCAPSERLLQVPLFFIFIFFHNLMMIIIKSIHCFISHEPWGEVDRRDWEKWQRIIETEIYFDKELCQSINTIFLYLATKFRLCCYALDFGEREIFHLHSHPSLIIVLLLSLLSSLLLVVILFENEKRNKICHSKGLINGGSEGVFLLINICFTSHYFHFILYYLLFTLIGY